MTIGQRILQARREAGLSQRELAGDQITRNMLSAIENDKARPSLETLGQIARKLQKPVGYFLGDGVPEALGYPELEKAREEYTAGAWRMCLKTLEEGQFGDVTGPEASLLKVLAGLSLAEQELAAGHVPYARELLDRIGETDCPYFTPELETRMHLLEGKTLEPGALGPLVDRLPREESLILRAKAALARGREGDALRYLNALDEQDESWFLLAGEACLAREEFAQAAACFHRVEEKLGKTVWKKLQLCYAGLRDFEKAYYYATRE